MNGPPDHRMGTGASLCHAQPVRRVCVVTGTRAEYGLLRAVVREIQQSSRLTLQLVVSGMHLSPEFGRTIREIEEDGFPIDRKVEMLLSSDSPVGIAKSIGLGVIGFADVFEQLLPDVLVLLGDRFEALAAAAAALPARIPIAHIHGGELTEGLIDEAIRHSLTKMSHLHFVATEEYRNRVIQLGEQPQHVHCVGGLGVDAISRLSLMTKGQVEEALAFKFAKRNLLVTFHPVTLEPNGAAAQMGQLLDALGALTDTGLIFTLPNADTHGRQLFDQIKDFCARHPHARAYSSLGQRGYLSCMSVCDGVIGNSSSGLTEAPTFRKGVINIGDRQRGRTRAQCVIDCEPDQAAIRRALDTLWSSEFRQQLDTCENPYGTGGASRAIVEVLEKVNLDCLIKKQFFSPSSS